MYHLDRITHPLKRVGPKGEGKFERITWDEVLDTIEQKLGKIKEEYGPESVLFCQDTGREEALKKMNLVVVADLFHNPTTMAVADIILPVASFAEKESFRSWWSPLQVIVPAVQVGECRSDWEINLELAKKFNPELKKRFATVKELIHDRLRPCGWRL